MARAVALFSGGLDSLLAILIVLKHGIEVKALKFITQFGCESPTSSKNISLVADKLGFEIKLIDLSDRFIEIVKSPKFGYGKNMNPCLDCKILMLKEAKMFMNTIGADFIATGEVLGQRPMSQRRDVLNLIDREAGVKGYVLRPLSAKLLKVTIPEAEGIVKKEMLYGFNGRSRKSQIGLAKEYGLTDYPTPAGGCLLTEPNYVHRLKDLLMYNPAPEMRDINLLRVGRHFRFSPLCKIIVGRDKVENDAISSLSGNGDCLLKVEGYGSPITLVTGEITDEAISVAASLCARYSDAKHLSEVEAIVIKDRNALCVMRNELKDKNASRVTHHGLRITDYEFRIKVSPASNEIIEALRIELKSPLTKIQ